MVLIPVRAHVRNGKQVEADARIAKQAMDFARERHKGQWLSKFWTLFFSALCS